MNLERKIELSSFGEALKARINEQSNTIPLKVGSSLPKRLQNRIQSLKSLDEKDIPEIKWIVPGLITEGFTILAGYLKSGKSLLAMSIAVALAEGLLVLGETEVEQGRVLYITPDDKQEARVRERIRKMREGRIEEIPLDIATDWLYLDRKDEDGVTGLDDLRSYLEAYPDTKMIVIDVLMSVLPDVKEGADAYSELYRRLSPLKELAQEFHVAILAVMHTNKSGNKSGSNPRSAIYGSQAYGAIAENLLIIDENYDTGERSLLCYGKDVTEGRVKLAFNKDSGRYSYGPKNTKDDLDLYYAPQTQTVIRGVREIVQAQPGITNKQVRSILLQSGTGSSAADQRIKRALDSGEICRDGRGYTPCQDSTEDGTDIDLD